MKPGDKLARRHALIERRRHLANELEAIDSALASIDQSLPPPSRAFKKGSVAATIVELLTIRPHRRSELRDELRRRLGRDVPDATLDTVLLRLKQALIVEQMRLRGPYTLARRGVAP